MDENLEAVRIRAYTIWEQAGRPDGKQDEHWQQALEDLGLAPAAGADRTSGLEDLPANATTMRLAHVPKSD